MSFTGWVGPLPAAHLPAFQGGAGAGGGAGGGAGALATHVSGPAPSH